MRRYILLVLLCVSCVAARKATTSVDKFERRCVTTGAFSAPIISLSYNFYAITGDDTVGVKFSTEHASVRWAGGDKAICLIDGKRVEYDARPAEPEFKRVDISRSGIKYREALLIQMPKAEFAALIKAQSAECRFGLSDMDRLAVTEQIRASMLEFFQEWSAAAKRPECQF